MCINLKCNGTARRQTSGKHFRIPTWRRHRRLIYHTDSADYHYPEPACTGRVYYCIPFSRMPFYIKNKDLEGILNSFSYIQNCNITNTCLWFGIKLDENT